MPTYEYLCRDCGHELEAKQAFTDDPLTECPSCGGDLRKRFAAPGITFKGSGFYKTDSRSGGKGSGSSTSSTSTTKDDTSAGPASTNGSDGATSSKGSSGSSEGSSSSASTAGATSSG